MKPLIVILVLASLTFIIAKPYVLHFVAEADFARRRNVWFLLTITAFLSPNFWIFVLVAAPAYIWAGRKDSNPVALYLMLLHVIPPLAVDIPAIGINQLFPLNNYRLLSLCVLIPTAMRARQTAGKRRIWLTDALLLAYGVVNVMLYVPPDLPNHLILPDSWTNLLRRAVLFLIDVYVLYFAVSRSCADRRKLIDAMATFCVSSVLMAVIGVFETAKHWLLYFGLEKWNPHDDLLRFAYLFHGSMLRAQGPAGHALVLGFLLAIAFGFWLYLRENLPRSPIRMAIPIILWMGLLATYSRGDWLGGLLILFVYAALGRTPLRGILKLAAAGALGIFIIGLTHFGAAALQSIPLIGHAKDPDLVYRQRLLDRSWTLIKAHPWFGDQLALTQMEDLRQGQGIIDVVNSYIEVALFNGFIGLALFVAFLLSGVLPLYRRVRAAWPRDPDEASLGLSILACALGAMLMIADISLMLGVEKMLYVLIGLATAYTQLGRTAPKSEPPAGTWA